MVLTAGGVRDRGNPPDVFQIVEHHLARLHRLGALSGGMRVHCRANGSQCTGAVNACNEAASPLFAKQASQHQVVGREPIVRPMTLS